jgi:predicted nucleic acid-binding protein
MSGNSFFVDTNIILYLLSGNRTIADILQKKQIFISFITQLELHGFLKESESELEIIKEFISQCTVVDINQNIKGIVVDLRRKYRIKFPDAIIMASSIYYNVPIFTADVDFKKVEEINLLFYQNFD